MIAHTTGKVIDYILKEEREKPDAERTVFHLRTLSKRATATIQDNLVGYDIAGSVVVSRPGTGALVACKLGIAGWENMQDADGNEVRPRFITSKGSKGGLQALSPKSLDVLPQFAIDELGGAIMDLNGLTTTGSEEEDEDATQDATQDASEDPTATSPTPTDSSSPPPSPPATPPRTTELSDTSARAPLAPA